jgi:hypothetical protein
MSLLARDSPLLHAIWLRLVELPVGSVLLVHTSPAFTRALLTELRANGLPCAQLGNNEWQFGRAGTFRQDTRLPGASFKLEIID